VVVSADHGTSCLSGNHIPDPVPLLVATWSEEGEGEAAAFDEEHAAMGALGLLHPGQLNDVLWPEDNSYSDA
jgi:2,3-bisphosphoglycerate-independent phosphoglycerate mutase